MIWLAKQLMVASRSHVQMLSGVNRNSHGLSIVFLYTIQQIHKRKLNSWYFRNHLYCHKTSTVSMEQNEVHRRSFSICKPLLLLRHMYLGSITSSIYSYHTQKFYCAVTRGTVQCLFIISVNYLSCCLPKILASRVIILTEVYICLG